MLAVWAVDSQEGQNVADPRSEHHGTPGDSGNVGPPRMAVVALAQRLRLLFTVISSIERPRISECQAVFGEVGVGGLDAEGAEHGDDLAAMEGGMVDGMKNDLPARDMEVSAIGHDGGKIGG